MRKSSSVPGESRRRRYGGARPHFLLARLYGKHRNTAATIAPLEKVTELDPKNPEGWYELGIALEDLHQFDRALDALQHAVALNGTEPAYLRDLAQIQMHFGRTDAARATLDRAAQLDAGHPATLVLL